MVDVGEIEGCAAEIKGMNQLMGENRIHFPLRRGCILAYNNLKCNHPHRSLIAQHSAQKQ